MPTFPIQAGVTCAPGDARGNHVTPSLRFERTLRHRHRVFGPFSLLILLGLLSSMLSSCGTTTVPGTSKPIAILLCKTSDVAAVPHPLSYYQDLFLQDGQGKGLLFDFWQEVSYQSINLLGSQIDGWYTMTSTKADLDPNVRNNSPSAKTHRDQTARDCISAAKAGGSKLALAQFTGVITIVNVPADGGYDGQSHIIIGDDATGPFPNPMPVGFLEHEMGHLFGLPHSWIMAPDTTPYHTWNHGGDTEYGDCWDIMSFATCDYSYSSANYGPDGPELEAAYRDRLGWMLPIHIYTPSKPGAQTITLAPINDLNTTGFLMAKIPVGTQEYYTVEFRHKSGFDQAIPRDAVLIHEFRNNQSYLVRYTAISGVVSSAWLSGQVFTDPQNHVKVTIGQFTNGGTQVTIESNFSPTIPLASVDCGSQQVISLPSPSGGTIVTSDHDTISVSYMQNLPYTKIGIVLVTGSSVTWWKGLEVHDSNDNIVGADYTQDTNHGPSSTIINLNQTIHALKLVVLKAKLFGVHTGMFCVPNLTSLESYTVTFTWTTDS